MLKGTQILSGVDAERYRKLIDSLRYCVGGFNYEEVILPSIWNALTFEDKLAGQTKDQMWKFKDKADRDCCLIPEATGIIQEMYDLHWSKEKPKPIRLFYVTKCFRYEKPQLGRLREFTQFGIELLADRRTETEEKEVREVLKDCLNVLGLKNFWFNEHVARGLGYYTADGFEVECPSLGAQKQVAGGGKYKQGIGWAIGVERLLLALDGEASSVG